MDRVPPLPRLPIILLGLLTLVTAGGPLAIWLVVGGGTDASWPPDRPVEWFVSGLVVMTDAVLFLACITIGWWRPGRARTEREPGRS